jgi:TonB family protein
MADRDDSPMKIATGAFGFLLLVGAAFAQAPQGREREANTVRWIERVERSVNEWQCGNPKTSCSTLQLVIENKSNEELSCRGSIRFPQPNANAIADSKEKKEQVGARGTKVIVYSMAPTGLQPASFETDCAPAGKLPQSPGTAHRDVTCRHEVIQGVNFDDYYPPGAKAEKREGKLLVEFTLAESLGFPTDISVRESSGHADLDAAGLRAIRAMKFSTSCPGDRSKFVIRFSLD